MATEGTDSLMALLQSQKTSASKGGKISALMDKYEAYKSNYAANIKFDSTVENFSKFRI